MSIVRYLILVVLQDFIKNNFFIDYVDYTYLQGHVKNNFIIDYTEYTDFQDCITNNFSINYTDYADFQDYINSVQDGYFRACSWMEGDKKAPFLISGTHILKWWNLAQLYFS